MPTPVRFRDALRWADGRPWFWPVAVGSFAFLVSVAGSWIPSLWGDEAASIMSAQRPWSSLFRMLGHIDAVHGTYYVFLHGWIDLFGASTFSVRLPSSIAVGFAAAGIGVLARRLGHPAIGVLAAVVFAVLPRTSYMGAEARSYALSATIAVWLTVLFVTLVQRRVTRWLPWLAYAVVLALGTYVFLYLALIVVVHAVVLVAWRARREIFYRWMLAAATAGVLALPVGLFAILERDQIAFLGERKPVTIYTFFVDQWFGGNIPLAVAGWLLVIITLIGVLKNASSRPSRPSRPSRVELVETRSVPRVELVETRTLASLALAWFGIPPLLLLIGDQFVPLYTLRYTSFVAPALAIILALALTAIAHSITARSRLSAERSIEQVMPAQTTPAYPAPTQHRPLAGARASTALIGAFVAVLVVTATPTLVAQRGPFAKDLGSDWAQVAQIVQSNAMPGDSIVFTQRGRPSRSPRLAMRLYPQAFEGLRDVTLISPYKQNRSIWDHTRTVAQAQSALARGNGRVWVVQYEGEFGNANERFEQFVALKAQGYQLVETIRAHRDTVYLFENPAVAPQPASFDDDDFDKRLTS